MRLIHYRACATKHQLSGLKEITNDDATQAPGYDQLSPGSQEQVRLAFENNSIIDKTFKDIRPDLAASSKFGGEITDAVGYKIDMPTRPAGCRAKQCANKIVRGQLRVGFLKPFDEDHSSWIYKHWYVVSNLICGAYLLIWSKELHLTVRHQCTQSLLRTRQIWRLRRC